MKQLLNSMNTPNNTITYIENIPVFEGYYKRKDTLQVKTTDTFSIMGDFFYKYGISEFNIIDLDVFYNPNRNVLKKTLDDRYQLELLYYSFVYIYWPMLPIAAFKEYIIDENSIKNLYPDICEDFP